MRPPQRRYSRDQIVHAGRWAWASSRGDDEPDLYFDGIDFWSGQRSQGRTPVAMGTCRERAGGTRETVTASSVDRRRGGRSSARPAAAARLAPGYLRNANPSSRKRRRAAAQAPAS